MIDRAARLAAARLVDWRFLLPNPRLGRVGVGEPADRELVAALADLGEEVATLSAVDLAADAGLDGVVLGERGHALGSTDVAAAARALRPGGWLLVELQRTRVGFGATHDIERAIRSAGLVQVRRFWSLPSRREARRIVPLDDRDALRAAMSIHGSRPARRLQGVVARQIAMLGGADRLGGEVTLLARRAGGPPLSGWPTLDALEPLLATEGLQHPSWILLTPRFPASAHVVLLLLAGGAPALVAKVARLPDDDGPGREANVLRAFHAAGGDAGSAPAVLHAGHLGGHSILLERALHGRPLDRRRVRSDPARWIEAVSAWTVRTPIAHPLTAAGYDALVREPIGALGRLSGDVGTARLVDATLDLVAPLRDARLPLVFEHGDLGHPNLLELGSGRIGVLDWELARPDGLPLNDLVFFLGYVALALAGDAADPFDSFIRVLSEPRWHASDAIRAEVHRLGLDASAVVPALIVACWARATASLADRLGESASMVASRSIAHHRYYSLWSRAVEDRGRLAALLS